MNRKGFTVLAGLLGGLMIGQAANASILVGFENASDLGSFLQNNNAAARTNMAASATGGVNGSGGVAVQGVTGGVDDTAVYQPSTVNLADGSVHTISMFVTSRSGLGSGDKPLQLGFVNGASKSFNGENFDTGFITARLLGNNNVEIQTKNAVAAAPNQGTASVGNTASTGVTANDWLQLILTLQETDTTAGKFNYTFSLLDYGPTGAGSPITAIGLQSGSVTVAGLANQALYAAFRDATPTAFTGIVNLDNFAVDAVPEPGSIGLLGLSALGLLARRRKAV